MSAVPARVRSMHITDSTLRHMAGRPEFTSEFPFLMTLRNPPPTSGSGCSSCNKNRAAAEQYEQLKLTVSQMASDQKLKMKEMLKIDLAYVTYRVGSGTQTVNF